MDGEREEEEMNRSELRKSYSTKCSPHDSVDHFHDNLVDDAEEVDNDLSLLAEGAEDSAKGEAEEDYAQGVGAGTVGQFSDHVASDGVVGSAWGLLEAVLGIDLDEE